MWRFWRIPELNARIGRCQESLKIDMAAHAATSCRVCKAMMARPKANRSTISHRAKKPPCQLAPEWPCDVPPLRPPKLNLSQVGRPFPCRASSKSPKLPRPKTLTRRRQAFFRRPILRQWTRTKKLRPSFSIRPSLSTIPRLSIRPKAPRTSPARFASS